MLARTSADCRSTSSPATLADPAVGRTRVDRMLIVVVLPAPLWPSSAHTEARATVKLTPCKAGCGGGHALPNDFARSRHSIAVSGMGVLLGVGHPGELGSHGVDVADDRLAGDLGAGVGDDQLRSFVHAGDAPARRRVLAG